LGIHINNAAEIELVNNLVAEFFEHGIWVEKGKNVLVDNNWVFHIPSSAKHEPKMMEYAVGFWGGITASGSVSGMVVTNNIVSGTWHHGFHFIPQKCDDDNPPYTFLNNVAHSISGYGAIAENVGNACTEVKDFTAYKTTEASIMLGGPSPMNRGTNLRSIDTRYGPAIFPSGG